MNSTFNTFAKRYLFAGLVILAIAKGIGVALLWFLPTVGVEISNRHDGDTSHYIRIDFSSFFDNTVAQKRGIPKESQNDKSSEIRDFILLGLYGNSQKGYAVLALKKDPSKSQIVALHETFHGYKLTKIFLDYVVLQKDSKEYIVRIEKKSEQTKTLHKQEFATEQKRVRKSDITYFSRHPQEIWKNIAIVENKENGNINGFKIRWIKPHSKFAALGLRQGDILIRVNDKWLRSYKDALDAYNEARSSKRVLLTVLRNNSQKEFIYEIY